MSYEDISGSLEFPMIIVQGQLDLLEGMKKHNKTLEDGIKQLNSILKILNNAKAKEKLQGNSQ